MFNRWDLTDGERWESARALGRTKWVLREFGLTFACSILVIWTMNGGPFSKLLD